MERKKLGVAVLTVALCGAVAGGMALAGCSTSPGADSKAPATGGTTTPEVTVGANGVSHIADWEKVYPLQTASFLNGANVIEERDGDDRSHSHALLAEEMEAFIPDATYSVRCMGCHSSWFKEITEAHGTSTEVMDSPMASYQDEFPNMEFWDCRTCHEDDPANILTPTNLTFKAVSKSYDFPEKDTVCGQCHSATSENLWETDWDAIDIYRNGVSADGLFQTFLDSEAEGLSKPVPGGEGGYITKYDEETGLKYYGGGSVVDLENFQGSNHQSLGLTCASCHMPQTTAEDGTVYTSHDASGSPIENPVALEYCLTCHKNQGIESPEAMKEFVLGKEDELAEGQLWMRENLETLKSAIAEAVASGDVDEATLDEARMAWSKGSWYLRYTYGHEGENVGRKAAHNFDQMMNLMQQGRQIVSEAIDSLA
ncbi:ammonia-forming cytochrome c nitrite reductase subunit c552 [Adlercreutzia sp. R21]|uniref:ammonia-forming cytochrome c nitrite reductase subunit c552 n=1 Tax=Adlercreutzia wanghongyangiae TaxID=3111451 RepID=UPI002DBFB1EA|nr:ammonia-forming cytochrome c nitrite reductase subunit c552 [Adlercreutzia sp. R21]MEC4183554.1 ammonia-forming cytochrome c nitrite reductase subunit c552 [Adlercreutzia sp. R21]